MAKTKVIGVYPGLAGVNEQLSGRVSRFLADYPHLRISSGYRSRADQERLYAGRAHNPNPVAKPGHSLHERGLAVDVPGLDAVPGVDSILARYGLSRPVKGDPVHIQLAGPGEAALPTPGASPRGSTLNQILGLGTPGHGMIRPQALPQSPYPGVPSAPVQPQRIAPAPPDVQLQVSGVPQVSLTPDQEQDPQQQMRETLGAPPSAPTGPSYLPFPQAPTLPPPPTRDQGSEDASRDQIVRGSLIANALGSLLGGGGYQGQALGLGAQALRGQGVHDQSAYEQALQAWGLGNREQSAAYNSQVSGVEHQNELLDKDYANRIRTFGIDSQNWDRRWDNLRADTKEFAAQKVAEARQQRLDQRDAAQVQMEAYRYLSTLTPADQKRALPFLNASVGHAYGFTLTAPGLSQATQIKEKQLAHTVAKDTTTHQDRQRGQDLRYKAALAGISARKEIAGEQIEAAYSRQQRGFDHALGMLKARGQGGSDLFKNLTAARGFSSAARAERRAADQLMKSTGTDFATGQPLPGLSPSDPRVLHHLHEADQNDRLAEEFVNRAGVGGVAHPKPRGPQMDPGKKAFHDELMGNLKEFHDLMHGK